MPVVSNTSPLLTLAIVGRLALLREQFGEIWMPSAVLSELRIEDDLPGSQSIREAITAGWLRVEAVKDRPFVKVLQRELDEGEAEAIALALQVTAECTLLDEREGRRVAKSLGIQVTGVVGILLRARREGSVPSLRRALEEIREQAGFRIDEALVADILRQIGEG
jgi:predicted nucleic acid-binding protein